MGRAPGRTAAHRPHLCGLWHAAAGPADQAATGARRGAALLAGQHQGAALVLLALLPRNDQAVVPAAHWPAGVGSALRCMLEAPAHMWGMHTCAPAGWHCTRARERCTSTEPHLPPLPPYPPPKRACTPAARRRGPAALLVNGRATGACVAAHEALIVLGGGRLLGALPARSASCVPDKRTNTFGVCQNRERRD